VKVLVSLGGFGSVVPAAWSTVRPWALEAVPELGSPRPAPGGAVVARLKAMVPKPIVLEATGRLEVPLARALIVAGLPGAVVNTNYSSVGSPDCQPSRSGSETTESVGNYRNQSATPLGHRRKLGVLETQ
jgi:hypothetical protein